MILASLSGKRGFVDPSPEWSNLIQQKKLYNGNKRSMLMSARFADKENKYNGLSIGKNDNC